MVLRFLLFLFNIIEHFLRLLIAYWMSTGIENFLNWKKIFKDY